MEPEPSRSQNRVRQKGSIWQSGLFESRNQRDRNHSNDTYTVWTYAAGTTTSHQCAFLGYNGHTKDRRYKNADTLDDFLPKSLLKTLAVRSNGKSSKSRSSPRLNGKSPKAEMFGLVAEKKTALPPQQRIEKT